MKKKYVYILLIFGNLCMCFGLAFSLFGTGQSSVVDIFKLVFFLLSALLLGAFIGGLRTLTMEKEDIPSQ